MKEIKQSFIRENTMHNEIMIYVPQSTDMTFTDVMFKDVVLILTEHKRKKTICPLETVKCGEIIEQKS